jgi:K(+)-stimulated pyrophosphate-energized sodium pump
MTAATSCIGFVLASGAAALLVAAVFAKGVLASSAGSSSMQEISAAIREGAHAFQRRQYRTVAILAAAVAVLVFVLYRMERGTDIAWRTAVAFIVGAVCSGAAGSWGMFVSLRANVRVAAAARTSVSHALDVALRGGAAAGLPVVAGSLLGVGALFALFGGLGQPTDTPYQIVGFAFGASFVALFAQLGGGIYTKAADIGADLVGKVDQDIPEDDPRNAAVIADLVGDNVGDCAGRGADIFESAAAENIGAMILGVALFPHFGSAGILFPLVAGGLGLAASVAGVCVVRMKDESEDPMAALTRGHVATLFVAAGGLLGAVHFLLGGNPWLFGAAVIGLMASFALAAITRYYTDVRRPPVRFIADSSVTGATSNVIGGLSVALVSTALPVLVLALALLGAYACGVLGLPNVTGAGVYGTAIATVGMLSSVGYVLSMDMFGPITDNAGGIVEMSDQDAVVHERTDRLDAAGNTTKATTKGFAIGSAALAAFLLFSAYLDEVTVLVRARLASAGDANWAAFRFESVDLGKVPVFVAALVSAAAVFVFSGLAIRAVARDAGAVIDEVRRQFREDAGILDGTTKPDYGRCVDIVTVGALEGMIAPGFLAVSVPVGIGFIVRTIAPNGDGLLAAEAVGGSLLVATIVGVLFAWVMNTGGAAWDNAKKLIESGDLGGKGSDAHKAAIVGDGVGDPLKDTAGPSLHVFIKLIGTVALVTAPLFL